MCRLFAFIATSYLDKASMYLPGRKREVLSTGLNKVSMGPQIEMLNKLYLYLDIV